MTDQHPTPPHSEHPPTPGESRRGFLGWMGRVGVATVGAIAGVTATGQAAFGVNAACCRLAKTPGGCTGSGSTFSCSRGYKRTWTCCWYASGTRGARYGCGECQSGSGNCWNGGTYYCSEYWFMNSSTC